MATEYKLSYTASEIDQKLAMVDETKNVLENNYYTSADVDTKIEEINESVDTKIGNANTILETKLASKADLVDGKIIAEQIPDDIVDLSGYYTKSEVDTALDNVSVDLSDYYTKTESDVALGNKADLVDGKVPLEQLPDNIGSGSSSEQVQADFDQNDSTQPDYIKNKPFYDTRKISYYSQEKTPNPVSFTLAATNNIFYKVSDLVPTREEIFGSIKILKGYKYADITEIVPVENDIMLEADEFIMCASESYSLLFVNTAGTVSFTYSGYNLSLEIPETGIYYVLSGMSSTMSEGRTVEVQLGGELKTLDVKFIPDMYYDTRVRSYYSQAENPNPVSFDNQMMNYSFYKISDLVPTREQIFGEMAIVNQYGNNTTPIEDNIVIETSEFIVTNDGSWSFCFINTAGTLSFTYSGYPMTIEVPEVGIYYIRPIGAGVPEGRIFEITLGGSLKQIDKKFLPVGVVNGIAGLDGSGKIPQNQINTVNGVSQYNYNPITSDAVYTALGYRSQLTFDSSPMSGSQNPVTSDGVYWAIENKNVTVDSSVQSGSNNAVSSNAVYNALNDKQDKIAVTTSDNGKFMRVVDGVWAAITVPNAEDGEF